MRKLQENGIPVYGDGRFLGIWYAGKSTWEYVNWHHLSFKAYSLEFNMGNPQVVISIPQNKNFIWTLKDGIPSVLIT